MSKTIIKKEDSQEENTQNGMQQNHALKVECSETRSILKHRDIDHDDFDDTESRRDSVKKLQFDESVIEIRMSYADPVDAEVLRTKLESLQKLQLLRKQTAAVGLNKHATETADVNRVNDQLTRTVSSIHEEHNVPNTTPQETFELRRKQFYKDEYKQVLLFNDIPSSSSNLSNDIGRAESNEH